MTFFLNLRYLTVLRIITYEIFYSFRIEVSQVPNHRTKIELISTSFQCGWSKAISISFHFKSRMNKIWRQLDIALKTIDWIERWLNFPKPKNHNFRWCVATNKLCELCAPIVSGDGYFNINFRETRNHKIAIGYRQSNGMRIRFRRVPRE